ELPARAGDPPRQPRPRRARARLGLRTLGARARAALSRAGGSPRAARAAAAALPAAPRARGARDQDAVTRAPTPSRRFSASRIGRTRRARRAAVYGAAFVVARYEYGVSSQPASGVPFSAAPSSPRSSYRSVIFQRKKSVSGRTPVVV